MDRWPRAMSLRTLADYLDVSVSSARRIVDSGAIPAIQFDARGNRYYLRDDVDAYLDRRRTEPVKA